jgi:hypothetical protein
VRRFAPSIYSPQADFTLEQLGWTPQPIVDDGWDGLVSLYRPLWECANRTKPAFHLVWMNALGAG